MPLGICYNVNKFIINKTYVFGSNLYSLDFLRGFFNFLDYNEIQTDNFIFNIA